MLNLYHTYIETHTHTHRHIHTYIHAEVWAILMNLSGHSHHHRAGLEKLLRVPLTHRSSSPSEKPVSAICAAVEKTFPSHTDHCHPRRSQYLPSLFPTARTKEENIQWHVLLQQCVIINSVSSKVRYSDREQLPVPSCRLLTQKACALCIGKDTCVGAWESPISHHMLSAE